MAGVEHRQERVGMPAGTPPLLERTVVVQDSVVTTDLKRSGVRDSVNSGRLTVRPGAIPWVANSIAMYEQMIRRANRVPGDSVPIDHFTWGSAGRHANFVKKLSPTEYAALYFTDPVSIRTDASGRIVLHDASNTTTKIIAKRAEGLDIDAITRGFAAAVPPGPTSPRDTVRARIGDAAIQVDYGRPSKRGRVIWGEVVPWNTVWRTGANAATQFSTTHSMMFGNTLLPAGAYTLWTLPSATGARLIINRQTGQWGTEYDPTRDFAHLEMKTNRTQKPVEQFTITITGDGKDGILRLTWDDRELSIPFQVLK